MGRIEVILLDTHVCVWWVLDSKKLSTAEAERLGEAEEEGLGVSIMSCVTEEGGTPSGRWLTEKGGTRAPGRSGTVKQVSARLPVPQKR